MLTKLNEVISNIEKLTNEEQRHFAKMVSDEINWDATLQNSQDKLTIVA